MTREVMISVSGADGTELCVRAEYFYRNGSHYLLYDEEASTDFKAAGKSRIKFREGRLEVIRRGEIRTALVVEEGKSNTVDYATPYGRIPMEVAGARISLEETEGRINVDAEYALKTNGQPLADCRIKIIVQAI